MPYYRDDLGKEMYLTIEDYYKKTKREKIPITPIKVYVPGIDELIEHTMVAICSLDYYYNEAGNRIHKSNVYEFCDETKELFKKYKNVKAIEKQIMEDIDEKKKEALNAFMTKLIKK